MNVKLFDVTPEAERVIARTARVSSDHPDNPEYVKLLRYMIAHAHWSPFEMACMTVQVDTSRMIAPQILRHKSMFFQERSLRYAEAVEFELYEARMQAGNNRQSSVDEAPLHLMLWWEKEQRRIQEICKQSYDDAISFGIARECARAVLPLSTGTTMFIRGTIRSWIHYLQLRTQPDTQKEHRDIAEACKAIFVEQLPTVSEALGWTNKHC